jgi:putative tricarboxylic transport membrane protein
VIRTIARSAADPAKVPFGGGSSVGGWDHLKVLLLAKAAGIKNLKAVKYVYFDSGGGALTQLLGGHVAAVTGDISEMKGQLNAGNVRILGVFSPERLKARPEIPTAKEQGYDVIGANWRGFYLPGGVPEEVHGAWGKIMEKLYKSAEWQKTMVESDLEPFWNDSVQFPKFVQQNIKELRELSLELGVIK